MLLASRALRYHSYDLEAASTFVAGLGRSSESASMTASAVSPAETP
eukprot:COSAG01_NODE_67549_length_266_cov_2.281437_1_plen_45_part_01